MLHVLRSRRIGMGEPALVQAPSKDRRQSSSNGRSTPDRSANRGGGGGKSNGSRASLVKNRHVIEESIYVGVPHKVAYDQWTQYGEWSSIFKKESARRGGDRGGRVSVTAKIGPSRREWQTDVVAQRPGRRIEWEARGGVQAKGVVTFARLDERLTHLQVVIQYKPSGVVESIGNFLRMPRRRVRKDLQLFKNYIELKGEATGQGPGPVRGEGLGRGIDEDLEHHAPQGGRSSGRNDGRQ